MSITARKPIHIPIIRNISPQTMADLLVSVQPMTQQTGQYFRFVKNRHPERTNILIADEDTFNEYQFGVQFADPEMFYMWRTDRETQMIEWANTNVRSGSWCKTECSFRFKSRDDQIAFILRWSE